MKPTAGIIRKVYYGGVALFLGMLLLIAWQQYMVETKRLTASAPEMYVFCLDGLEWNVVDKMLADGKLPNIRRLIDQGWSADLRSAEWSVSPAIWTTIFTGQDPEEHGIWNWEYYDTATQRGLPAGSAQRRVPAIWNILDRYGYSTAVFNQLSTYPGEPINGCVIPYRSYYNDFQGVYPATLRQEITALDFRVDKAYPDVHDYAALTDYLENRFAYERQVSTWLTSSTDYDVYLLYVDVLDHVQHKFMQFYEPSVFGEGWDATPENVRNYGKVIPDFYARTDAFIGALMRDIDLATTTILVVSDHGFRPEPAFVKFFDINAILRTAGYQRMTPAGEIDHEGSAAIGRFIGGNRYIVGVSGTSYQQRQVERILREVRYEDGSLPWGVSYGDTVDVMPTGSTAPMQIFLNLSLDTVMHEQLYICDKPYPLEQFASYSSNSGQHRIDGVLIMAGPGVAPGPRAAARIQDVCPTILQLLSLPVARDFAGRPLTEALTEELRASNPVRWVESFYPAPAGADTAAAQTDTAELRDSLRSLGYIQ